MNICTHCSRENPDDFSYCRYCGNPMQAAPQNDAAKKWWKRLPAWAWILIFVGGGLALIATMIGSFIAIATMEGVASAVLLIAGMVGFGLTPLRRPERNGAFFKAIGLSFFALMGATVDQTGNYIYNKPIEISMCDEGSSLTRNENVFNPLPGTTYIEQDFTCYNDAGEPVKRLNIFAIMGIRFIEYVLLGYLLIGLRRAIWKLRHRTQ